MSTLRWRIAALASRQGTEVACRGSSEMAQAAHRLANQLMRQGAGDLYAARQLASMLMQRRGWRAGRSGAAASEAAEAERR